MPVISQNLPISRYLKLFHSKLPFINTVTLIKSAVVVRKRYITIRKILIIINDSSSFSFLSSEIVKL